MVFKELEVNTLGSAWTLAIGYHVPGPQTWLNSVNRRPDLLPALGNLLEPSPSKSGHLLLF